MSDANTTTTTDQNASASDSQAAQTASNASTASSSTSEATLLGGNESQQQQQQQSTDAKPVDRPDWLPEKFWTDKGPNVEHLAKSYHGLEQLLGKKAQALVPPNEKSTPEELEAWRKALGVPESPDGYTLKPDKLPPGTTWDDTTAKKVAEIAHRNNVPASAMKDLLAFDIERQQQWAQAAAAVAQQELAAGKDALKSAFADKFDANISLAKRAVATVGGNAGSRGFTDPEVVKVIVGLAQKLSDDTLVAGDNIGLNGSKSRAKDIQTNPENPLHKRYLEGDAEVVDQVRRMITA